MFIDAHCHLNMEDFQNDTDDVIARAHDGGVGLMIVVGWDIASSEKAIELAEKYDFIYAACGIHPHDTKDATEADLARLKELLPHEKVVAVGEIGLDFYKNYSPRGVQEVFFQKQSEIAGEFNLPIMLHVRDAHDEMIHFMEHIKKRNAAQDFIVHCFSGNTDHAKKYQSLGGTLSFSGTVTFENARRIQESASETALQNLLTETDAPFLTPHPDRGKRNEPLLVKKVAEKCAAIKSVSVDDINRCVLENCLNVFKKIKREDFLTTA